MNITKVSKESARSKVMSSWQSSWKSMAKEPPIIPIIDIQLSRTQKLIQKSEKKVLDNCSDVRKGVTNENSLKLLSNMKTITNKTEDKRKECPKTSDRKELRSKSDSKRIKDKPIVDKPKQSVNKVSISEQKVNSKQTETNDKNSVYIRLRKRKNDSNNQSIGSQENRLSEEVLVTKAVEPVLSDHKNRDKGIEAKAIEQKVCEKIEKKSENCGKVKEVVKTTVQPMELDSDQSLCVRIDCNKPINKFYLYENKFCSTVCALNQWTEDFHKTWGFKTPK